MIKDELVPEIHDILKLCRNEKISGSEKPVSPHSNPELVYNHSSINIKTKTFEGVCKHHVKEKLFPDTNNLFLLKVADNLSAAVSRDLSEHELGDDAHKKVGVDDKIFKIWKDTSNSISKDRQIRPLSIDDVIKFIGAYPTAGEFFKAYDEPLKTRSESALIGTNITTLWTHSELTGRFYRLLQKCGYKVNNEDISTKEKVSEKSKEIEELWELKVAHIKIFFSQQFFRTKDLNVIEALKKIQKLLIENYEDFILFSSIDEYLMVIPLSKSVEEILNKYLEPYGFWYHMTERKQKIKDLSPDPLSLKKEIDKLHKDAEEMIKKQIDHIPKEKITNEVIERIKKTNLEKYNEKYEQFLKEEKEGHFRKVSIYPFILVDQIKPPLCEICQLFPANPVSDELSGLNECLCNKCLSIQEMGESLRLLGSWEGTDVVWIKIKLNFDILIGSLRSLYKKYLQQVGLDSFKENADIRFSVISEFQKDYRLFLDDFNKSLNELFINNGESRIEHILDDFYVVRLNKLAEINDVLIKYRTLIDTFFPKFKEIEDSPIKLVISCSHVKFPFFVHWRYLENPKNDVEVMLIGKGKMKIKLSQLEDLLSLKLENKTALEKLAKISETSEQLSWMQLFSKDGAKYLPELQKALSRGFKLQDLLTFVKIKSD